MFEVEEERLEELASEYEVSVDTVREYAEMLLVCSLTPDLETYDRMIERAVSMLNPIFVEEEVSKKHRRSREDILTKTMQVTFNDYDDDEIKEEVQTMLKVIQEKRK